MDTCEHCGADLATFEGEAYCPDCTRWEMEADLEQALDEALALRAAEAEMATADDSPTLDAGELPF
jgi:uncharacterized Zn finger protein (UPF0148 family)